MQGNTNHKGSTGRLGRRGSTGLALLALTVGIAAVPGASPAQATDAPAGHALNGPPVLRPYADGKRRSAEQVDRMAAAYSHRLAAKHKGTVARASIYVGSLNYLTTSNTGCYLMLARAGQIQQYIAGTHGFTDPAQTLSGNCPDYTRQGGEDDIGYTSNLEMENGGGWIHCAWAMAIVGAETPVKGELTAHKGYCSTGDTDVLFTYFWDPLTAIQVMNYWPENDVRDMAIDGGWYALRRSLAAASKGQPSVMHKRPKAKVLGRRHAHVHQEARACGRDGRLLGRTRAERKVFAKMRPQRGCASGTVVYATPAGGNAHAANNGGGGYGAVICGVNGQPARNRSGKKVWVRGTFACNAAFEGFTLTTYCRYQAKSTTKKTIGNPKTAGTYQVLFTKVGGTKGTRIVSETAVFAFTNIGYIRVNTTQSHI